MKRLTALLLLVALLVPSGVAYAFDPPDQGTDNATDVILWHGDNLTIQSANLTIADLEDALAAAAQAHADTLTDSMDGISDNWLSFFIVAFILMLIFWRGGVILKALGMPVAFVYGFVTAGNADVFSPLWVAGVAIGILGLYFLYQIALEGISLLGRRKT